MERLDRRDVVAIVDDDPFVRAALSSLLRCADLEVVEFGSGEEFLAATAVPPIGVLIADVRMPGMSGFELCRRLNRAGTRPPTIFISAIDSAQARRESVAAGAFAFLPKPFAPERLIQVVASALRTGRVGAASQRISAG
jgi:FixJ family two-component response regulator